MIVHTYLAAIVAANTSLPQNSRSCMASCMIFEITSLDVCSNAYTSSHSGTHTCSTHAYAHYAQNIIINNIVF